MNTPRCISAILFGLLVLLVPAALQAQVAPAPKGASVDREYADTVHVYSKTGIDTIEHVKVTSATYEKVTYKPRGAAPTTVVGAKVAGISYGDTPKYYVEGEQAMDQQDYETALRDFQGSANAAKAGRCRAWIDEYAAVKEGEARLAMAMMPKGGSIDGAVSAFQEALKANPKSLLYDDIQAGLAKAYMEAKSWPKAQTAANALVAAGKSSQNAVFEARGTRLLAEILGGQGQFAEAANAFDNLVQLAKREAPYAVSPILKRRLERMEIDAAIDEGWSYIHRAETTKSSSDWDSAKSYFQGLEGQYPGNEEIRAAAANGRGRVQMENDPRGALETFIRVQVLDFDVPNEVARALYLQAQARKKMGGSRNQQKAKEARALIRENFPKSKWAHLH